MISFIVPAHNEQRCLGRTLEAIHESAKAAGRPYEVIVVNDASTDATAEIAQANHARVVNVNHRQIAATRNSGARAAHGEYFFFVDADTTANPSAVAAVLNALDHGAAGGGGATRIDENDPVPLYIRLLGVVAVLAPKLIGFTGGAFMFCTRAAFYATGGFNEKLFWAEEGGFALALKREGKFFVPWNPLVTSGRRFRKVSGLQLLAGGLRLLGSPVKTFTQRSSVAKVWYDSNRADDDKIPGSVAAKISNAVILVLLLIGLTGPVWDFIPWTLTPLDSPLGKYRFFINLFLCPLGMIGWPLGMVLGVNFFRQKRWTGVFQSCVLITFCFWQAWLSTQGVIRIGTHFSHWLKHASIF